VGFHAEREVCFTIINQDKGGQGMKKLVIVCLVLVFGAFTAGAALAASYSVQVTNSKVYAKANSVNTLETGFSGTVLGLDPNYNPWKSGTDPVQLTTSLPAGTWDAAGWWEFNVTGSTGDDWNNVFKSDKSWLFETKWTGTGTSALLSAHFDATNTFDNVYGRWYKNNDDVWTYFGLYVHPNTGEAQPPVVLPPTGIFAFVANDSDLSSFKDFGTLYAASQGGAFSVTGDGTVTATPVPPSVWLLGSGLIGLVGLRRRFTAFLKK
jgi:hypothetical protein